MNAKRSIFLIGFSGSGKSAVGRKLAKILKVRFFDTDTMIVDKAGKDVTRIFRENGERYFRHLERQVIAALTRTPNVRKVVALGGGAFEDKVNRDRVLQSGLVIYLSCSLRVLYGRLKAMRDRPKLTSVDRPDASFAVKLKARIRTLRDRRLRHYRKADVIISTSSRTVTQTAREIVKRL